MTKWKIHRPILTTAMLKGYFGKIARGWPFEEMYDEGPTSSVFGQDMYRLNEGPIDVRHQEHSENLIEDLTVVDAEDLSKDECAGDEADVWIKSKETKKDTGGGG